jgi:CheY-like chemotaxis protein
VNCTVLIIEDHADTGESYARLLRRHGMAAYLASTAEEIDSALTTLRPDVLLIDYHLGPAGDGIDLLRRISSSPSLGRAAVLMMSASVQPERVHQEAERLGARAWLEKSSLHVSDLMAAVERFCPNRN